MFISNMAKREIAESIKTVAVMASEAKSIAETTRSDHRGHEVLCTERWTESRQAMKAVSEQIGDISKAITNALRWALGTVLLSFLGVLAWFGAHFITFNFH